MKKLFVFDLDDTLVDNVHDYADAILNAVRLIIQTLGNKAPHVSQIIAIEQEIDKRRVKEINPETGNPYLYSMERFPGSQVETYKEICRQARVKPKPEVEKTLYNIGLDAFNENRYIENIKPHTTIVLDFLREQGDTLILYSKGDKRVQDKKLTALQKAGINHFSKVFVVDDKVLDDFRKIASQFPNHSLYSVGNNYKSDILPALEAGFTGIFIPVETWEVIGKMDEILAQVDKNKCKVFKSLLILKTQYGRLK